MSRFEIKLLRGLFQIPADALSQIRFLVFLNVYEKEIKPPETSQRLASSLFVGIHHQLIIQGPLQDVIWCRVISSLQKDGLHSFNNFVVLVSAQENIKIENDFVQFKNISSRLALYKSNYFETQLLQVRSNLMKIFERCFNFVRAYLKSLYIGGTDSIYQLSTSLS